MKLVRVTGKNIEKVWKKFGHMLDKSITFCKGVHTSESIYEDLLKERQQLWVCIEDKEIVYIGTTKIDTHKKPKRKIAFIMFLGGNKKDNKHSFLKFSKEIGEWAKLNECDYVLTYIRKGGARLIKKIGWKFVDNTEWGKLMIMELQHDNI